MSKDDPELLPELRDLIAAKPAAQTGWKPNAAFEKLVKPDGDLEQIVGSDPMTRSELGKRLWEYIRVNDLQDASNGRLINANDAVAKILNGDRRVSATELMKRVFKHVK